MKFLLTLFHNSNVGNAHGLFMMEIEQQTKLKPVKLWTSPLQLSYFSKLCLWLSLIFGCYRIAIVKMNVLI